MTARKPQSRQCRAAQTNAKMAINNQYSLAPQGLRILRSRAWRGSAITQSTLHDRHCLVLTHPIGAICKLYISTES
jgi:hypothetical protein